MAICDFSNFLLWEGHSSSVCKYFDRKIVKLEPNISQRKMSRNTKPARIRVTDERIQEVEVMIVHFKEISWIQYPGADIFVWGQIA